MADGIDIQVRGDKALRAKLNQIADVELKKILRRAMRDGAKVILPQARANAPVGATGRLKKAIKVRSAKRSRKYVGMTVVLGEGFLQGETFYGAFQEFGWKTGKRKSDNRRQIAGKHFLQRAGEAKGKAAGDRVVASAWRQLKARALMRGGLGGGIV